MSSSISSRELALLVMSAFFSASSGSPSSALQRQLSLCLPQQSQVWLAAEPLLSHPSLGVKDEKDWGWREDGMQRLCWAWWMHALWPLRARPPRCRALACPQPLMFQAWIFCEPPCPVLFSWVPQLNSSPGALTKLPFCPCLPPGL